MQKRKPFYTVTLYKKDCETEITNSNLESIRQFIQTWVPDYVMRQIRNVDFSYSFFPWELILKQSFLVGNPWSCFSALTHKRLDGLLCLAIEDDKLKIEYIATAPWNYYTEGKMRRIGSGLIYYTMRYSIYINCDGELTRQNCHERHPIYYAKIIGHKVNHNIMRRVSY